MRSIIDPSQLGGRHASDIESAAYETRPGYGGGKDLYLTVVLRTGEKASFGAVPILTPEDLAQLSTEPTISVGYPLRNVTLNASQEYARQREELERVERWLVSHRIPVAAIA